MSTILKALKRLEDEKKANVEQPLDEKIVAPEISETPKNRVALIAVALIGGIGVGAATLFFLPGDAEDEAVTPIRESVADTAPAPVVEKKIERVASQRPTAAAPESPGATPKLAIKEERPPPSKMDSAAMAEMMKAMGDAMKQKGANPPQQPAVVNTPTPPKAKVEVDIASVKKNERDNHNARSRRSNRSTRASEEAASAVTAPPIVPEVEQRVAAAVPPPARVPEERLAFTQPASKPIPKLSKRAEVPPVRVKKTVWHPDADRRHAVISFASNGETIELKEGDAIGPLIVKSIKPGGVLFYHDGIEIRYNVGD